MAKSRADGTPAKATRKASPTKSTKAKSATPERTTRTSPRRSVPSAKAQEDTIDHVQTGRVAKKTSPAKAKASPKKTSPTKTTTSVKKATATTKTTPSKPSPVKASPAKSKKAATPTEEAATPAASYWHRMRELFPESDLLEFDELAWWLRNYNAIEDFANSATINKDLIFRGYGLLLDNKSELDGNARKTDGERAQRLKPEYRKLKKAMRDLLGGDLDECLKKDVPFAGFVQAFRLAKMAERKELDSEHDRRKAFVEFKNLTALPRDQIPKIRFEDTAQKELTPEAEKYITERRAAFEQVFNDVKAEEAAGRITTKEQRKAFIDQGMQNHRANIGRPPRLYAQQEERVAAGRVTKAPSRAASRSRSPAKSPAKTATRKASKSPAPIDRSRIRSQSPARVAVRQIFGLSPTKASTRRASQSPAPLSAAKTRSKSPAKTEVAKSGSKDWTSSRKSAERDSLYQPAEDGGVDEQDEPAPQPARRASKSPAKRATSASGRSPSPAKKTRASSPAKAKVSPAPASARTRSKSPAKKSSSRKSSTTAASYGRPHPTHPGRGEIISPTNPQTIVSLNKPNPFHETLPAPEIWHRRMPSYFPFSETPYMEREISRQIEEDLARGMEETRQAQHKNDGIIKRVASFATSAADAVRNTFSPSKQAKRYPSPWDLPPVNDAEFKSFSKSQRGPASDKYGGDDDESDSSDSLYMSSGLPH